MGAGRAGRECVQHWLGSVIMFGLDAMVRGRLKRILVRGLGRHRFVYSYHIKSSEHTSLLSEVCRSAQDANGKPEHPLLSTPSKVQRTPSAP